ncbi:MAG TPA: hypothetical protein VM869_19170 [Enhygromyxa sp.]|nr:hypothetical protein [Enhygromyxa sp.]
MRNRILLSVHPRHAEAILAGTKLFEFRRVVPARPPRWVSLYATAPVLRIVGEFEVARVLSDEPAELWADTAEFAGITRAEFDRYFHGKQLAHAFEVFEPLRFEHAIDPRALAKNSGCVFNPPQSFCYWPAEGWS